MCVQVSYPQVIVFFNPCLLISPSLLLCFEEFWYQLNMSTIVSSRPRKKKERSSMLLLVRNLLFAKDLIFKMSFWVDIKYCFLFFFICTSYYNQDILWGGQKSGILEGRLKGRKYQHTLVTVKLYQLKSTVKTWKWTAFSFNTCGSRAAP